MIDILFLYLLANFKKFLSPSERDNDLLNTFWNSKITNPIPSSIAENIKEKNVKERSVRLLKVKPIKKKKT